MINFFLLIPLWAPHSLPWLHLHFPEKPIPPQFPKLLRLGHWKRIPSSTIFDWSDLTYQPKVYFKQMKMVGQPVLFFHFFGDNYSKCMMCISLMLIHRNYSSFLLVLQTRKEKKKTDQDRFWFEFCTSQRDRSSLSFSSAVVCPDFASHLRAIVRVYRKMKKVRASDRKR